MENDWDNAGFVDASSHRQRVLERLNDGPASPSSIADDTDIHRNNVSNVVNDLRDRGLVSLLVSEDRRKGRIYGITEQGQRALERLDTQN